MFLPNVTISHKRMPYDHLQENKHKIVNVMYDKTLFNLHSFTYTSLSVVVIP